MPFALIPTALGVCFLLIWAFIGGMILRDSHHVAAAQGERHDHHWRYKNPRRHAA